MTTTMAYWGEDFCLIHGREHMRSYTGNPIPSGKTRAKGNLIFNLIACLISKPSESDNQDGIRQH
jgi:hypothetical protein